MSETVAFTIEGDDGSTDEVAVPAALLEMLAEGDEPAAEIIGDLALFSCAQRVHATVHHAEGEPDDDLAAVEEETMELFEERFGASFSELTGHSH
ncbi:DUF7545 family protein [Halalkalicoccus salilacus]|uniref:DUF7545 family protein n=1 Tax=Halalkalicoccus salilacus TaxID=3117459 RepID=UPI00300F074F